MSRRRRFGEIFERFLRERERERAEKEEIERKMSESKETAVAVIPSVEIVKKNEEGGAYCEDCDTNTVYEKDGKMSCFQCGAQMESSSLVNTTEFNADGQVCFLSYIVRTHIYYIQK